MEVTLITEDGQRKTIQIPEMSNYPEVLVSNGKAFRKHPQTDEYNQCSFWIVPISENWEFLSSSDKT